MTALMVSGSSPPRGIYLDRRSRRKKNVCKDQGVNQEPAQKIVGISERWYRILGLPVTTTGLKVHGAGAITGT